MLLLNHHSHIREDQEIAVRPVNDTACRRTELRWWIGPPERPLIQDNAILEKGGRVLDKFFLFQSVGL
tara:strand:+ start:564 stop:767 length:204 start_codon:yes stop_codon:yes gene_type:complete